MKVAAIIAEYNPLHQGHLFHMEETKRRTGADALIVIMSGSFVQRGEPAIVDKYRRANAATQCGADLVIELPVLFSLQSAEGFARGSVALVKGTGIVDYLSFGSEAGDLAPLERMAALQAQSNVEYHLTLRRGLAQGLSYTKAAHHAAQTHLGLDRHKRLGSNDILGIEYLKALEGSKIKPMTIARRGSYLSKEITKEQHPSATALRHSLLRGDSARSLEEHIPFPMAKSLNLFQLEYGQFPSVNQLRPHLQQLLLIEERDLRTITRYETGLDNLLKKVIRRNEDLVTALYTASSTRYTLSRLQRFVLNSLLNISQGDVDQALLGEQLYLRPLSFNAQGQRLMSRIKKEGSLPLLSRFAEGFEGEAPSPHLKREVKATSLYEMLIGGRDFDQDFTNSPRLYVPDNPDSTMMNLDQIDAPVILDDTNDFDILKDLDDPAKT
ncbi:MAG: nucleotidyltransferase family protein [Tissierellia bacterium]|nr:nucleotidyltransferase family protein [Tissierellia bacterium]